MIIPQFLIFDFETLSTNIFDAPILSLGAIAGKWTDTPDKLREFGFYRTVKTDEQLALGLKPSKHTLNWWLSQKGAAKDVITCKKKIPVQQVLDEFNAWCSGVNILKDTPVYIRAPHFDFPILLNLYKRVYGDKLADKLIPFSHWKIRDTRSVIDLLYDVNNGYMPNREQYFAEHGIVEHNALDDCIKEFLQLKPYFESKE